MQDMHAKKLLDKVSTNIRTSGFLQCFSIIKGKMYSWFFFFNLKLYVLFTYPPKNKLDHHYAAWISNIFSQFACLNIFKSALKLFLL